MQGVNPEPITRRSWQAGLTRFAGYIGIALILIALPLFLPTYFQSMAAKILIFAIGALSLNLIFGYTGLYSFGHAAFFGAGTYTLAILIVHYGIESFWLLAPASILVATLLAAIFGIIALRVSGIYFVLITIALGELTYSLIIKFPSVTGGSDALPGIIPPDLGLTWLTWTTTNFYYFVFLTFIICFLLLYLIVNSPFGYALQGIRENETRMRSLGYNTWLYKYIAFIIAGSFAGVAGVLFGYFLRIAAPVQVGVATSTILVLMVIMGSSRVFFGPAIGALLVILLEYFTGIYIPKRWPLILGGVFVIVILFFREGVSVYVINFWEKVLARWKH